MRLKRFLLPALLAVGVLAATAALAVGGNFGLDTAAGGTGIPTGQTIPSLIASILRTALGFVGTLFLLLMIYAGFLWMTARGDSKKVDTAKQMITGAIIGVVLIAGAYAVTAFVLTAVTNPSAGESNVPAESCSPRPCTTNPDCVVAGSNCYTGTCTAGSCVLQAP